MRIGELSRRTSVSRDTIRFYERKGLIRSRPGRENSNNYRDYPQETELTLRLILEAKAAGFTLEDLRRFMEQLDGAQSDGFDGEAFLDAKIAEVEESISRSRRFLKTLRLARRALSMGSEVSS